MTAADAELDRLVAQCAARLQDPATADATALEPDFRRLLDAVRTLDRAFDFDRDGRPGAIAAVREALPLQERELLDAIVEDHACEIAAIQEAMRRVVRLLASRRGQPGLG